MESENCTNRARFDLYTARNLVGDLGEMILRLIQQDCIIDKDLLKFGSITLECLAVKIQLLHSLGLIDSRTEPYGLTEYGREYLDKIIGWKT